MNDAIEAELGTFIVAEFLYGEGAVAPEQDLFGTNVLDSLGVIRLIAWLSDRYGVVVPPADITVDNFDTLRKVAGYVRSHR